MLLAVDVGNSQTHIGLWRADELVSQWRIGTDQRRSSDELALIFQELLGFADLSFPKSVTGVIIASVVPRITTTLRDMIQRYFHLQPIVVGPGIKTGVPILYENPREVGADRVANAVAAYSLYGGPVIVVDFGTATTFDAISDKGEYLGGAIAPGVEISTHALFSLTAQVPGVEVSMPRSVIGRTTAESVRAGIVLGTASMVDGMVERISKELLCAPPVVATGGLASWVIEQCSRIDHFQPNLTLFGLRMVYERNV